MCMETSSSKYSYKIQIMKKPTLSIAIKFACLLFISQIFPLISFGTEDQEIKKSLDLLRIAAKGHIEKKSCFACHNQAFPMLAFSTAIKKNYPIPSSEIKAQTDFILNFLQKNEERYLQGKGTGGDADTAGYAMLTLELAGIKPNKTTDAVVVYFLKHQAANGYWKVTSNRPPSEASNFTTNYLAIRALKFWGNPSLKKEIEDRSGKSLSYILETNPVSNEDQVFKLLALNELNAEKSQIQSSAGQILGRQKPDGGWAQIEGMETDPYATATALVSLHMTGIINNDSKVFKDGIKYLSGKRKEDGSWFVKSRSKPFQTYYESGFPHKNDQFISVTASGWATTALLLSLPEKN